jgi:hypothetical protein
MPDRSCSRGHHDKPVNGVCPRCLEIAEMELDPVPAEAHFSIVTVEGNGSDFFPAEEEQG